MHYPNMTLRFVTTLAVLSLAACGGDDDANQPDAQAGTGGVGGSGGSGGNESDAGGTGGGMDAGGTGGSGGTSGTGGGLAIDDVDYTLGGFNQDLPAPSVDCLTQEVAFGCMSISGEYNGEVFEMVCSENTFSIGNDARHIFGCRKDIAAGDFLVEFIIGSNVVHTPPFAFEVSAPEPRIFYDTWNRTRDAKTYLYRTFSMYQLATTHDQEYCATGTSEYDMDRFGNEHWRVQGTFGVSHTPKDTCVPDTMGFGCDAVRFRATFRAYPTLM